MTQSPLILSVGISDDRLSDPEWAGDMIDLAQRARIDLLLLGDGRAAPFDALAFASWLAPRAGGVGLVPTLDTGRDLPHDVARALAALDIATQGAAGWQPTTLAQEPTADSVPQGVDFVAATRGLWRQTLDVASPPQPHPVLVQNDADPLWSHVGADIVIIDMDSPRPPPGPKVLLRTFTALAGIDEIEALYRDGVIDGIHLTPPFPRRGLQEFTDTMLPTLIQHGVLPETRRSGTLRQRLDLPTAPRRFQAELAD